MKILIPSLLIALLSSCTIRKKETLNKIAYELGDHSKLIVNSLKRTDDKLEFKLLAISNGADSVVIKANDIECGVGKMKFRKVRAQSNPDNLIIVAKLAYTEFDINCMNHKDVNNDDLVPYLKFKKIYKLEGKKQGAVLDENVIIKFE